MFGQTGGLCYGQKAVDSIRNWSDPNSSQTEVTYTYKLVNRASWAKQSEIQQAFPSIKATINGASSTNQNTGLQLIYHGWEVISH